MPKTNEPVYLPLDSALTYLRENEYYDVLNKIDNIQANYSGRKNRNIKKGIIVSELEKLGKLNEFCEKYWPNGKSDTGIKVIRRYKNIISHFSDSIEDNDDDSENEITRAVSSFEETSFAYEDDLRDYLVNNLSLIEDGLKLFIDDKGIEGVEYSINENNKRIDILSLDRNGIPVIIELKVKRGYERVIGQCQYYKNRLRNVLNVKNVRVIIIAREITDYLKTATIDLEGFELFEYELNIELNKIEQTGHYD